MKNTKGFTLIELMVVIAIIGILAALTVTSWNIYQDRAEDTERQAVLTQARGIAEEYWMTDRTYEGIETYPPLESLLEGIEVEPYIMADEEYCMHVDLTGGDYFCVDSGGHAGIGECIDYSCSN